MNPPPPVPFGDPTSVRRDNRNAILKGFGLGCGGCGMLLAGFIVLIAAFVFFVFSSIGNSDAVDAAVKYATDSAVVRESLGYPIEKRRFVTGSVNWSNDAGCADVTIPISGPNGKGSLHAVGRKDAGVPLWKFTALTFTAEGSSEALDLLNGPVEKP